MSVFNYPVETVHLTKEETDKKVFYIGAIGTNSMILKDSGEWLSYKEQKNTLLFSIIDEKRRKHKLNFLKNSDVFENLPFLNIEHSDLYPTKISSLLWNPLIFNNDIDSSIPAALIEFVFSNTTENSISFEFAATLTSPYATFKHVDESKNNVYCNTLFGDINQESISLATKDKNDDFSAYDNSISYIYR